MTAMPISQVREQLFPLVRQVNDDHSTVEIVAKGGNAVLMSADDYASMQETIYLFSNPANAAHLALGFAEADAGTAAPLDVDSLLARLADQA